MDLARLRVDKWKTDGGTRQQTEKDAGSVAQNLQLALPGMLENLKNSPENLALTFKVYHNLDALSDVFSSVVESAGAFGTKDEFQSLSKDLGAIEDSRRAFADRMDKLANAKEAELGQLRAALQPLAPKRLPRKPSLTTTLPPRSRRFTRNRSRNPQPRPQLRPTPPATQPAPHP